jgi:hypothetical protein
MMRFEEQNEQIYTPYNFSIISGLRDSEGEPCEVTMIPVSIMTEKILLFDQNYQIQISSDEKEFYVRNIFLLVSD